jgi:RsiW-degrading membrane proteinase PrsW (M82 family)
MTGIWITVLTIEIGLFVWGFLYALLLGNKDVHWLIRALLGATFFAFFYIAIPAVYITEYLENKKS